MIEWQEARTAITQAILVAERSVLCIFNPQDAAIVLLSAYYVLNIYYTRRMHQLLFSTIEHFTETEKAIMQDQAQPFSAGTLT